MPEWMRTTLEIVNTGLLVLCFLLLLVIWEEIRSFRTENKEKSQCYDKTFICPTHGKVHY